MWLGSSECICSCNCLFSICAGLCSECTIVAPRTQSGLMSDSLGQCAVSIPKSLPHSLSLSLLSPKLKGTMKKSGAQKKGSYSNRVRCPGTGAHGRQGNECGRWVPDLTTHTPVVRQVWSPDWQHQRHLEGNTLEIQIPGLHRGSVGTKTGEVRPGDVFCQAPQVTLTRTRAEASLPCTDVCIVISGLSLWWWTLARETCHA